MEKLSYSGIALEKYQRASHLLYHTINSCHRIALIGLLFFSFVSYPFLLVSFVFLRFLSKIIYFCIGLTAYSIYNQCLWIFMDIHECMLFRVLFLQAVAQENKEFFNTSHCSVTKKPFQVKSLAKVLSKAPPGSLSCSQCDSVMGSVGCLPDPNPASFPNPTQIKPRLRG